jgi:caffeoyl-CoA O-methyltransferase
LPRNGRITTLEINPAAIAVAKKYFELSNHGKKIEIKQGPALESLKQLSGPFDFVFIDADKTNYLNYYEAVLPKIPTGGVIVVDNVLWSGAVLDPKTEHDMTIVEFNNKIAKDTRVEKVMLTVRDGVYLIRKK